MKACSIWQDGLQALGSRKTPYLLSHVDLPRVEVGVTLSKVSAGGNLSSVCGQIACLASSEVSPRKLSCRLLTHIHSQASAGLRQEEAPGKIL